LGEVNKAARRDEDVGGADEFLRCRFIAENAAIEVEGRRAVVEQLDVINLGIVRVSQKFINDKSV